MPARKAKASVVRVRRPITGRPQRSANFLQTQRVFYNLRRKKTTILKRISKGLSQADIKALRQYFAAVEKFSKAIGKEMEKNRTTMSEGQRTYFTKLLAELAAEARRNSWRKN
ncbi:MAG: hypothetical protein Q7S21_06800 [archaeon]|nr:hypothetical protein [archaeon]